MSETNTQTLTINTMKTRIVRLLLAACVCALPSLGLAQAHYPNGAEGIKAASLPPPGTYFRDYNVFYFADRLKDGPPDFDKTFVYVNAPRLIWITEKKILGADYGMDIILPFAYQSVKVGGDTSEHWSFGDIQLEPLLLSWHKEKMDIAAGYALWVPSGDYKSGPTPVALGYWGNMFTLGATYYFDKDKTWAISALNRYEVNLEHPDSGITPGNEYTLEAAISKTLKKGIDVGAVGYFQWQTTEDCGTGASDKLDQVIGVGPEVSMFCSKLGLNTSLRYYYEFGANDRPEGHKVVMTFTRRF